MTTKIENILWVDRWSKYIWLAYSQVENKVSFPLWYLLNDSMIYFNIADIIQRYNIKKIILWRPTKQKDIQEKINNFIKNLEYIIDKKKISIEKIDENYTSVQSGEIISNFKKNVAEDTVSAMLILERRQNPKNFT